MESAMLASIFGSLLMILLAAATDGTKAFDKSKHTYKSLGGHVTVAHQKQAVSHLTWRAEDGQSLFCKTNGLIGSTSSCNLYHLFTPKDEGNPDTHVSDVRYSVSKVDESSGVYTFNLNYGPNQNDLVDCGTPPKLSNATSTPAVTTRFNTTLTFTCDPGYRDFGRDDHITCQEDGTWSETSLDCRAMTTTRTLSAGPATLTCTNRISDGYGRKQSVSCEKDEVLTDCSSKIDSRSYGRNNGVKVVMDKNTPTCLLDSTKIKKEYARKMWAVARCCKLKGIQCEYFTDGPTGNNKGEHIKSECAKPFHVLGCSAFMVDGWLDGVKIESEYCSAFVGLYSNTGVSTFSTCCKAPGYSCKIHKGSSRIRHRLMKKTCPPGSVLTGCAGYESYAGQRGSYIQDVRGTPTCIVEGSNSGSVVYYVCCRSKSM